MYDGNVNNNNKTNNNYVWPVRAGEWFNKTPSPLAGEGWGEGGVLGWGG